MSSDATVPRDGPEQKGHSMLKGFKDFIMRGNVVDLAVAVVIGLAFAAVINALVVVIMDLIGKAGGTPDFSAWAPHGIHIGAFLTALISFLIVAAAVYFLVVAPLNALAARRARGQEPQTEAPSEEIVLLTEIRDALRVR
jgi:large conductance mechanosensitive channel